MNNIIFFDVDGTLVKEGRISRKTIETINKLHESNNLIIIATGRSPGQMQDVLNTVYYDGYIACNGALGVFNNKILFEKMIDKKEIKSLFSECDTNNLSYAFLSKDYFATTLKNNKLIKEFVDSFSIDYPKVVLEDYLDKNNILSLGIYHKKDITDIIKKYNNLTFMPVSPIGYDVVLNGCQKGNSIIDFISKLNIPYSKTIAIGDNTNDINMFLNVATSICMGQAPEHVKKHATYITKSIDEEGLSYAFTDILKLVRK